MVFTGKRLADFEYLQQLRRSRVIDANEYRVGKTRLENAERQFVAKKARKEAVRAAREMQVIEARRMAERAMKATAKVAKSQIKNLRIRKDTDFTDAEVYRFFKNLKMQKFQVSMKAYGRRDASVATLIPMSISFELDMENTSKTFSNIIKDARAMLKLKSDEPLILINNSNLSFAAIKRVKAKKAIQRFKEGIVNCFMSPIIKQLEERMEGKSKHTVQNIKSLLKHARAFESQYRQSGVPEEDIENICNVLKYSVRIKSVIGETETVYNEKARYAISFTNTKLNHVDVGDLVMNNKPADISEQEMYNMIYDMNENETPYVIDGMARDGKPRMARTLNGAFRIFDEKARLMDEQYAKYGFDVKAVNASENPELASYLQSGYIVNATQVFLSDETPTCLIDLKKAYAQFKECPMYTGFPSKINRYAKFPDGISTYFLERNIGIYTIQFTNVKSNVLNKLGFYTGGIYTLPSVEILYLEKKFYEEVDFHILAGAWGSSFDMDFSPEFVSSGVFREWSGRLGMDNKARVYTFPKRDGYNQKFAEDLQYKNPDCKVFYYDEKIRIFVPKKYRPTYFHIAAFITSYTRINILEKMSEIGFGCVSMVMLDGIYTTKPVEDCDLFKNKKVVLKENIEAKWYEETLCPEFTEYDGVESSMALLGAGGSGKTFSILESSSYHKVLYVSPTRMLGTKMQEKTGCKWTTACKFLGLDTEGKAVRKYIEEYPRINVVLLDELTMMSADMVAGIVQICKENDIMLLIAGDVEGKQWFQTKNGDGSQMHELYDISGWDVKYFKTDYRAMNCETLKTFKTSLRQKMREVFTDGGRADCAKIESWVSDIVPMASYYDAVKDFKNGDFWIAPTHAMSQKLIKDNVCSGYRISHAGTCSDGVFRERGEMVSNDVGKSCEKRGSFTTHSCQGLTIKSKLFISVFGSFDYSMLYTAISRAEEWSQLVFVWNF
jgi:hypothetical protein